MSNKLFFPTLLSLTAAASLSAQAPAALNTAQMAELDIFNVVHLLEQNALLALIGAVLLMGIGWICYVFKACAQLNKPQENTRIRPFMTLLILVAGLSVFCSSCSVEQQAMAARYRAAEAAENGACPMNHRYNNQADVAFHNRYPYSGYSNGQGPAFCKHCGQRIFKTR